MVFVLAAFNPHWLDGIISPYSSGWIVILRVAFLVYSLVLCCLLIVIFSFRGNWQGSLLSKFGSDTLFFYLAHPYVLYGFVRLWTQFCGRINILDTLVIVLLTVVVLSLMEKAKNKLCY